jgi:exodeoxyribonuclease VII large subunit
VQGEEAAGTITRLLGVANERAECDLLVLARGGGSLEDLWAFNEESVARSIAASRIPVITGIGHEIDLTIADLVADLPAPTPSAAAELVTPDQTDLRQRLHLLTLRFSALARTGVKERRQALEWLVKRHELPPRRHLLDFAQRQDQLALRLARSAQALTVSRQARLATLSVRLERCNPCLRLAGQAAHREQLHHRLRQAVQHRCSHARLRLQSLRLQLEAMSPLRTLERGYAIVTRRSDGLLVRATQDVTSGEQVNARLARATLRCTVNEIDEG